MSHDPNVSNLAFLEELYADFLRDPTSVGPQWSEFFARNGGGAPAGWSPGPTLPVPGLFAGPSSGKSSRRDAAGNCEDEVRIATLQQRVEQLTRNYRVRGHIIARLDPLGSTPSVPPELEPAFYGFAEADMNLEFTTDPINGRTRWTLREIIERLRSTYCRSIGAQFMHIDDLAVRQWLTTRMESTQNHVQLTRPEQLSILSHLTDAVIFEEFIQKKFLGAKSFSLEGAETLIPLLGQALEQAGALGFDEIVLAMAHRGRLNVLANVVGKSPQQIFREFADVDPEMHIGRGDVKYHLGHSGDWITAAGHKIHVSLCFNPSHLEFVNPVALGRIRAKQDRAGDARHERGMAVIIHGDAAFIGEGIVQETLNLSQLPGYETGGTLHVIVNNQIGFTTPPEQGRSTVYASDVARMLQIPIFHVNGEDPEAVAAVVRLAMDFRAAFKRDVVIDMYCYRRRGHNESDEASFTQPLMYRAIERRKPVREGYLDHLLQLDGVTQEEADRIAEARRQRLEEELSIAKGPEFVHRADVPGGVWNGYVGGPEAAADDPETGVPVERLAAVLERLATLPEGVRVNPKIKRGLEGRRAMARGEKPLDWAAGEAAALGSLALEGARVRLSGQDCERGTFSQRHAVLHDAQDGRTFTPLAHFDPSQAPVEIYNSPLSEAGVMGFDYGYSLDCPDGLVMWEAQFGDFVNAAQVIIDQFITSAEEKWRRLSGLTLLLPHGFEGQGPEHSSARLERFLQLCANDNIQVAYPTTPAQYFHLLRRQVVRKWRKPLVVMTPKSLLRHPQAVSLLEELASGRFERVIGDPNFANAAPGSARVERVLLCSGKVYFDLIEKRDELGRQRDVAIVRVEQLYPLPVESLRAALAPLPDGTPAVWVQEEPENMGAWRFLRVLLGERLFDRMPFLRASRPAAASPATGSRSSHKLEQDQLLNEAFAVKPPTSAGAAVAPAAVNGFASNDSAVAASAVAAAGAGKVHKSVRSRS